MDENKKRTGDIIMFRHETPLIFQGDNGYNIDVHIIKNLFKRFFALSQPYYSHAGVVVVRNGIPYVLHVTADSNFDNYRKKYVIGSPALTSMDKIEEYKGFVFHYPYLGKDIDFECNMKKIYNNNIVLNGNWFIVALSYSTGRRISKKYLCTEFVAHILDLMGIEKYDNEFCCLNKVANIGLNGKYGELCMLRTTTHKGLSKYYEYLK